MANVAVLGYGTIGAGVVKVLQANAAVIEKRAGQKIEVKKILDLRDFPDDPNADKITHDYEEIARDGGINVVVECMGGVEPAYSFVKRALLDGRSVVTSNKELVAKHGAELIRIASEKQSNFLFGASVGGGIPIIRPILASLSADVICSIKGILNGTTNYILTAMEERGWSFEKALKKAQELGYAERNPRADVDGFDTCRKIAILTSLVLEHQVDFEDIETEGISAVTTEDIRYALKLHRAIKLLAVSTMKDGKNYAMVSPFMIDETAPLASVTDVFNAILVHGNMSDDIMFYGKGAGSLPTASAVSADVVDCIRNLGHHKEIRWSPEKAALSDNGGFSRKFFVRLENEVTEEKIGEAFGQVDYVVLSDLEEKAFVTGFMTEDAFKDAVEKTGHLINRIRLD